jgi:N-acetylmuramoyl-L-alanine amidase
MALIVIDRQHVGKPGKDDTGAWNDYDEDRTADVLELEAILTGFYGLWCEVRLRELGHNVISLGDGHYVDRHKRANSYKADAYIALHLNAGKGDYSLVLHDARSKAGPRLAACISEAFAKVLPTSRHIFEGTSPTARFPRGYNCIDGVFSGTAVAALVEPLFIDNPKHFAFLRDEKNLRVLGSALADGIDTWLKSR